MAGQRPDPSFEFQRLHGMGEALHRSCSQAGTRCRIYAPVGAHRDLLAYLVRRLLENGANSSFVNQIVDESVPPKRSPPIPFARALANDPIQNPASACRATCSQPERENSKGFDLRRPARRWLIEARGPFVDTHWTARPILADDAARGGRESRAFPARPAGSGREVHEATGRCGAALDAAQAGFEQWSATPVAKRAAVLRRAADLYEEHGRDLRARWRARPARRCSTPWRGARGGRFPALLRRRRGRGAGRRPRGVFACISPWNFPLAIFTGQIAAALAAGNAVLAKPAEQTPLIAAAPGELHARPACRATRAAIAAGRRPDGRRALTSDPRIDGVCLHRLDRDGAAHPPRHGRASRARMPLIAETGGLNAMIVDSTALPEQAVRDIVASAFQSAGQRCSALRCSTCRRMSRRMILRC
jgi:RHH-type proline utilization regulon transcriptional repressor/proline dehydrogenase/delta 1-pyrroline-5-carboxylate dehydrogenase